MQLTASIRGGQVPEGPVGAARQAPHRGAAHAPPSCGRATTPPQIAGDVWHNDALELTVRQAAATVDTVDELTHGRQEEEARVEVGAVLAIVNATTTGALGRSSVNASARGRARTISTTNSAIGDVGERVDGEAITAARRHRSAAAAGSRDVEVVRPGDVAAGIALERTANMLREASADTLAAAAGNGSDWPGSRIHWVALRSRGSRVSPPARDPSASVDAAGCRPLHHTVPTTTASHPTSKGPRARVMWETAVGGGEVRGVGALLTGDVGGAVTSSV